MMRSLSLLALLLASCGAEPAPPPPPVAEPAVVGPAPVAFADAAFVCCGNERIQAVVSEYLDLQAALAQDDQAQSRAALQSLREVALLAADDAGLSGHSRGLARQVAGLIEPLEASSTAELRRGFQEVSQKVIILAQANRGGERQVAVALCTKSNANWLQATAQLANPYLGSLEAGSGVFRP
jgi:hypothetical protein